VIGVDFGSVPGVPEVQEALPQSLFVANTIGAVNPGIADNDGTFWQFQFRNLSLDLFVRKSGLLDSNNLSAITICVNERAKQDILLYTT
jgi:hypothetical protein